MSSNWYSKGVRGATPRQHSEDSLNDSFVMDQDDPALLEAFFKQHMVNGTLRRRHSYANSLYSTRGSSRILSKDLPKDMYVHASNASAMKPFNKSKSYYTQWNPRDASAYTREKAIDHAASEIIGKLRVVNPYIGNKKRHSPKERMYLNHLPEETRCKIPSIVIRKAERLEEDSVTRADQGNYDYYKELLDDLAHGTDLDGGPLEDIKKNVETEAVDNNNESFFLKKAPSINLPFFICGTGEDTEEENYEYHTALKQIKNELPKVRKHNTYLYLHSNREQLVNVKKVGPVKQASKKKGMVNSIKSALRRDSKSEEQGTFFDRLLSQVKSKKRHRRSHVH